MLPTQLRGAATPPAECALAFAIPTTAEEFVADLAAGPAKDFAAHVTRRAAAATDADRRALFDASPYPPALAILDGVAADAAAHGVTVVRRLDLDALPGLLGRFAVITLVTHCTGELVEFFDGMHPVADMVTRVPYRSGAILDLSMCNSAVPADAVKARHPEWEVGSNRRVLELRKSLILYKHRIRLLAASPVNYIDADMAFRKALGGG
jgi:hypothetical protein